jgi:DNA-binding GntR family transcriptional regulator
LFFWYTKGQLWRTKVDQDNATLSERLLRGLEEDILAGRLLPGEFLDERTLALRYDVSRTPVREALLRLAMIGVVDMRPRHRTRMASIPLPSIVQMLEVMACLEAQAAGWAARRMSDEDRAALGDIQLRAGAIVAAEDVNGFNDINWSLHLAIYAGCGNDFLAQQARDLRFRLHPYRCFMVRLKGRMEEAHAEHAVLVEAILEGRDKEAAELMRSHLRVDAEKMAELVAITGEKNRQEQRFA